MKIKTNDLIGPALNWAVAKCEGHQNSIGWQVFVRDDNGNECQFCPSDDWAQGGPIIEREKLDLRWSVLWEAWMCTDKRNAALEFTGPTPLIAAMRCYVASKMGEEVEVPEELS